ncbi:ABC transporter permease [Herbaspirillum sp. LeCh32-8]|uniref:ABC transporter permease n=1 Tax=Herbaspirillum sp. LeCh32-8 TaxID=2821356 RepID=UPI001AEB9DC9|nr:ABC transporter permease [Herbaspirillum sp. LeCh32-8]MBP0598839.1 ABC transporter permease [Herbaspirillum sp. LeCh32-8]
MTNTSAPTMSATPNTQVPVARIKWNLAGALPMVALMLVGYVVPGLLIFFISLGGDPGAWADFAFDSSKYVATFQSGYFWKVLGFTMAVSAGVAVLNAVLAYPIAFFLARSKSRWVAPCYLITFTPLAVGMNMLTVGWLIMLGQSGVVNSVLMGLGVISDPLPLSYGVSAVVIGLAHVSFTFMVLPLESVLRNIKPALEHAATSLGAPAWKVFLTITFPLSLEGVAAGMLIVFMQSCGAFVIPLLLGGSSTVMLPVAIGEQLTVANDRATAAALSVILTGIALTVLFIQLRYFNKLKDPA